MIRIYIESRIGKISDEEFQMACVVAKNYILGELGGSINAKNLNRLMIDTVMTLRKYDTFRKYA